MLSQLNQVFKLSVAGMGPTDILAALRDESCRSLLYLNSMDSLSVPIEGSSIVEFHLADLAIAVKFVMSLSGRGHVR